MRRKGEPPPTTRRKSNFQMYPHDPKMKMMLALGTMVQGKDRALKFRMQPAYMPKLKRRRIWHADVELMRLSEWLGE